MRHGALIFLLLLLFTGFVNSAVAQQHIFQIYSSNDGMVTNSVRRIFQDSRGFLWIATWEGLSKYDGHKFTNYTTANGLSHNLVNDIHESAGGKIYIACNDGSIDIITENETIQKAVFSNVIVNRFRKTSDNRVIAVTDKDGLYEFTNEKLIKPRQTYPASSYYDLAELSDSFLIAGADSSLRILTRKYELFSELQKQSPAYNECKIYKDSKKRIWVGSAEGLKLLSPQQKDQQSPVFAPLPPGFDLPLFHQTRISEIFEDSNGNLWIGTTNGLMKIKPDGSSQLFNKKNGLPSDHIGCIYQDREMNIWIGTTLGVARLVTKTNISIYTSENGVSADQVGFVQTTLSGDIIASALNGLNVFDKTTGRFLAPLPSGAYFSWYVKNSNPLILINRNESLQYYDASARLPGDILRFNKPLPPIYTAVADDYQNIFISGNGRLIICSGQMVAEDSSLTSAVTSMLIDKKGYLWAGTVEKGLYRFQYNHKDNPITLVLKDHYLPTKHIRCLYEDRHGSIWAGTRYHGVFHLNAAKEYSVQNFDQSKGLTSNWVRAINEDAKGCIWIGFYLGIDKLIPADTAFRVFNFSRVNYFFANINSITPDSDNSIWLATASGLVHIKDGEMENLSPLPVYIRSVSIADTVYKFNAVKASAEQHLHYRQNQVQFEFSSPGFINEKQVLYSYRLLGSNYTDWSVQSGEHSVSYASLQPGEYRFEVRMLGWNGSWGNTASFEFVILPPFWKTWWFISICAIFLTAVIYWIVRKRIAIIRHESEMKNKITETEMMALRAQMNPHFIFNCLNSIDNLIQTDQKEKATDYLAKFARLIRAILENSKNNTIPCWKDLEALQLYLQMEELRWDKKITCDVTIANEIQNGDYKVPPMIIQPFVENAIHHGLLNKIAPDKKLSIDVKLEGNKIKYTITDNGVGRVKAGEYKKLNRSSGASFGMQITKERIDLFNQDTNGSVKITDLYNQQQQPEGTMAEVWLTTQPLTT